MNYTVNENEGSLNITLYLTYPLPNDIMVPIESNSSGELCYCKGKYVYHIVRKFGGRKFGEFGKSLPICQTITIQISAYN